MWDFSSEFALAAKVKQWANCTTLSSILLCPNVSAHPVQHYQRQRQQYHHQQPPPSPPSPTALPDNSTSCLCCCALPCTISSITARRSQASQRRPPAPRMCLSSAAPLSCMMYVWRVRVCQCVCVCVRVCACVRMCACVRACEDFVLLFHQMPAPQTCVVVVVVRAFGCRRSQSSSRQLQSSLRKNFQW